MILSTSVLLAVFLVLNVFQPVLAELSGTPDDSKFCKDPLQRKEWRALSDDEKNCYIEAIKCLQSRPAQNTSRPASWTRFDEFQATHIESALDIHFVGQFLPWHRLFMKSYETALRNECGYQGAQPYWNWSLDADPPNLICDSPIWNPVTGFGGDGVPGTYIVPPDPANTSRIYPFLYHGCIKDGPFADYTLKLGPGLLVTEHCIARGVNNTMSIYLNSSAVAEVLTYPNFEQFRVKLEGVLFGALAPHGGGHGAVGGEMTNFFSSPGDPLFYMHHTNIDRIWWLWQEACSDRLYEICGPTSVTPPYGNVTLDYPLKMGDVGPTLTIRDVMDIRQEHSCYTYV